MSSILIGVRVRPFNQRERKFGSKCIVGMPPAKAGSVSLRHVRQGKITGDEPRAFQYDYAFMSHDEEADNYANQGRIFDLLGEPTVQNIMEGYNSTLLAYGQTGSGKTYSMMGYDEDPGLIPRIASKLFMSLDTACEEADDAQMHIEATYLEIYNEGVFDLLSEESHRQSLKVRQHPKTGVFVEGISKHATHCTEDILEILERGNHARMVAATEMNSSSSRSHAVLQLTVHLTTTVKGVISGKYARLMLVDLAGSERASSSGATGDTLVEGANINRSLTTLGMCLSRLAEMSDTGRQGLPIPFRDSCLTFLLHDSLGGNSRTAMLAAVSPADVNYEETLGTLRFAATTKKVKNKAIINENPAAKLIRELTEELSSLKERFSALQMRKTAPMVSPRVAVEEVEIAQLIAESEAAQDSLASAVIPAPPTSERAHHNALEERTSNVFVDWREPHLVNLCPESPLLILAVRAGHMFISMENPKNPSTRIDHSSEVSPKTLFSLFFSPLLGNVQVRAYVEAVFVNGSEVAIGDDVTLHHSDRLAHGAVIFRVAHNSSIPNVPEYSKIFLCDDHVAMAEEYHRCFVSHMWLHQLSALVRGVVEEGDPTLYDELQAELIAMLSDMRSSETRLTSQYPVTSLELAGYARNHHLLQDADDVMLLQVPFDTDTQSWWREGKAAYDAALKEQSANIRHRESMIMDLRSEIEQLAKESDAVEQSSINPDVTASDADEAAALRREAEKALAEELRWHQSVKELQSAKPEGPTDKKDLQIWTQFARENKKKFPFLSQIIRDQASGESTSRRGVFLKMKHDKDSWDERYFVIAGSFLHYFHGGDGTLRCLGALYLLGARISIVAAQGSQKHALLVRTACPRRAEDPADNAFYFAFYSEPDMLMWFHWLSLCSTPPVPITIQCRLQKEADTLRASGALTLDTARMYPQLLVLPPVAWCGDSITVKGATGTQGLWKNDETVSKCEKCEEKFSMFLRRHHCRICGGIFCDKCCPRTNTQRECLNCNTK